MDHHIAVSASNGVTEKGGAMNICLPFVQTRDNRSHRLNDLLKLFRRSAPCGLFHQGWQGWPEQS